MSDLKIAMWMLLRFEKKYGEKAEYMMLGVSKIMDAMKCADNDEDFECMLNEARATIKELSEKVTLAE